jgi:hypothetical protein
MNIKYLRFFIWLLIGVINPFFSYSQNVEPSPDLFIASTIPDSLKQGANSVLRYYSEINIVHGPGKLTTKYHKIVTILNEKAEHEAIFQLGYNKKFYSVNSIIMLVYDDKGILIKKYHKSDMYDGAASNDETLVSDDRFLGLKHTIVSYPITIEEEYQYDNSSFLDLGQWKIQSNEQSVQNSNYQILVDKNAGLRYLNKNTTIKPSITNVGDKISYSWQVANIKAIKLEEGAMGWRVFPHIFFAVNNFEFYSLPGDFSSWQTYCNWQKALNADVCSLTPEREAEIRKMTDTIKTDKAKAMFLYKYLQQNMRYVSVQLGIGGLKPFPAMFVDQKKYGDCKALSNYMGALLKAVNIPSCYAMINAEPNAEPAEFSFPFDPFNHVILCIPFKNDTTWLECTSTTKPFGKLGPSTENRRALIITEDGGKLVNTPKSKIEDNKFIGEANLILNADGSAKATFKISATGGYRDELIGIAYAKADEQKEYFLNRYNIKQPAEFELSPFTEVNESKEVIVNLEYDKFCDIIAGDKQFLRPKVFDLCGFSVPIEERRNSDYYFEHPLQKTSTTKINLPQGFEVETLPASQSLKFTYGNYEINYLYDAAKNLITSTAKFKITNQVIPAANYAEMQQFFDGIIKIQNKKLVIRKKA